MKLLLFILLALPLLGAPSISYAITIEPPPAIAKRMARLQQEPLKYEVEIKATALLIERLENLQVPSLEQGLKSSGLSKSEIQKLKNAGSKFSALDKIIETSWHPETYSLGMGTDLNHYAMLLERTGLLHWEQAYVKVGIDWRDYDRQNLEHTTVFMDQITKHKEIDRLVMFIPNNVMTHPSAGYTKKELQWLMRNPDRLKKVIFVFGLYDVITPEMNELREAAGFSRDEFKALFLRALGMKTTSWDELL